MPINQARLKHLDFVKKLNSINYIEILFFRKIFISMLQNVYSRVAKSRNTGKHIPLNKIVLVTLKKEVEVVFNFTIVTYGIFNCVFLVEMEM